MRRDAAEIINPDPATVAKHEARVVGWLKLRALDVGETSRKIELRTPANPVSQAFLSKDSLTNDSGLEFEKQQSESQFINESFALPLILTLSL